MTSACNSPSALMLGSQLPAISLVLAFNERMLVAESSPMPARVRSSSDTREMILARIESWLSMRDPGSSKSGTCYWCAKKVTENYSQPSLRIRLANSAYVNHGLPYGWCGGSEVRIIAARGFVMRTSEPKPHQINKLASVLSIPKFEPWLRKCYELRNRDTRQFSATPAARSRN